jgi:hypothetical protein
MNPLKMHQKLPRDYGPQGLSSFGSCTIGVFFLLAAIVSTLW